MKYDNKKRLILLLLIDDTLMCCNMKYGQKSFNHISYSNTSIIIYILFLIFNLKTHFTNPISKWMKDDLIPFNLSLLASQLLGTGHSSIPHNLPR